jgi:hypothetical protein
MREKKEIGVFITESIGVDAEHGERYTFTFVPNMSNVNKFYSIDGMEMEQLEDCFCMLTMFGDEIKSRILEKTHKQSKI